MMATRGMGQADLIANISAEQLLAAYRQGQEQFPEEEKQLCPIGEFSDDPLIPGICNQTILAGAALLVALFFILGRRG